MIPATNVEGKQVAVLGLGRSGLASIRALQAGGGQALAWDDDPAVRKAAVGAPLVDLSAVDWSAVSSLVISPGIPHHHPKPHPVAAQASAAGVEIIGDVELLFRACPETHFIGITGTNGKSTTTALLAHVLESAGRDIRLGGNIGIAALDLKPPAADSWFVLEMSSFQLELTPSAAFDPAVLLNIAPDHLERHGGMEGYLAAKQLIFSAHQTAIIGMDDAASRRIYAKVKKTNKKRVIPIAATRQVAGGVFADNNRLMDGLDGPPVAVCDLGQLANLRGAHNLQNAVATYATARTLGISTQQIVAAFASYPGLAHRQELVCVADGISFINDSKATNPDAAARALATFDNIYWIAGGRPKNLDGAPFEPYLERLRHAVLIGEAAPQLSRILDGRVGVTLAATLDEAVAIARNRAATDDSGDAVVLLSPACASFDQFDNFEERGTCFRRAVLDITDNGGP